MNQLERAMIEAEQEAAPRLRVVGPPNGACNRENPSAPLALPTRMRSSKPRPELAVLGFEARSRRLSGAR
jgi:hypothetical protein